jgi:cell division septal protein FtsQ
MFPFGFLRRKRRFPKPAPSQRAGARLLRLMLRLFLLAFLLGILVLLAWFGLSLYRFMFKSPYFEYDSDRISIRFDESNATGEESAIRLQILRRLRWKKQVRGNLLKLDIEEVRKEIENHPKVRAAGVRKIYPNTLEVEITQRRPVALLIHDGILAVDMDGVVVETVGTRDPKSLLYPFITGIETGKTDPGSRIQSESLTKALQLILCMKDKAPALFQKISEVHCDKERNLTLVLKGGTQIRFGADNPIARMPKLETFIKEMGPPEQFDYINLRFDDQVPAMPKPPAAPP